jgi:F-type H+-transporting ATPase subunit epsilon
MFKLNFATPDKKIIADQELEEIILPAFSGELNILPGHAPLLTTLEAGILQYRLKSGEEQKYAIGHGYCQVSTEGVNVLSESALQQKEIDVLVVQKLLKENESRLANESLEEGEWNLTQATIGRLKAELDLAGGTASH